MPQSDDKRTFSDRLAAFHVDYDAIASLPSNFRASTTVAIIIGIIVSIGLAAMSLFVLGRLCWDAVTLPGTTYQESAKSFILALAGVFGAPFLVWRAWVAYRQTQASLQQALVAEENHITGIFSKSVELLGLMREMKTTGPGGVAIVCSLPNLESRLGGLFSLERLLRESAKDRRAVLETLCAYVRENSPARIAETNKVSEGAVADERPTSTSQRNDVQAAVTIIGRRPEVVRIQASNEGWNLDLRNSNLSGCDLSKSNFDRADFSGSDVVGADLSKSDFKHCRFTNTNLNKANLKQTNFHGSIFNHCQLKKAKIDNSDSTSCTMIDTDPRLAEVTSFDIRGADLEEAFNYSLEFAVKAAKGGDTNHFNVEEILHTYQLFQKSTFDGQTSVSQATREAVQMMGPHKEAQHPQPSTLDDVG